MTAAANPDATLWLAGSAGCPSLYLRRCLCGNPIVAPAPVPESCELHGERVCGLPGCTRRRMVGSRGSAYTLCSHHAKRRYAHGHPLYEPPALVPTYRTAHCRVQRACGRASGHLCVDCGGQARDWSYIGGDPQERTDPVTGFIYGMDPTCYEPRCRGCHVAHDGRRRDRLGRWAS